jgi:hypothetical protein
MALDTSVLQYQPVTQVNPLQQAVQFQQLRNLATAGQAQQQQLQEGQLDIEAKQRQIDETKALNQAYLSAINPDGTIDSGKIAPGLIQSGHGNLVPKIQKGIADSQKSMADAAKANADAATAQTDFLGTVGSTLKTANYDPRLAVVKALSAAKSGAVDKNTALVFAKQVDDALTQDPTGASARQIVQQNADQWIAQSGAQQKLINERTSAQGTAQRGQAAAGELALKTQQQNATQAAKDRQSKLTAYALAPPAQKAEALAALSPDDQKTVAGMSDDDVLHLGMTPSEIEADTRGKATAAQTAAHESVDESLSRARLGIAQQEFALKKNQQAAADDPYGSLTPAMRPVADKLAFGDLSFAQLGRFPAATKVALMAGAVQKNPSLTASTFDTKQNFLNSSKPEGKNLQTVTRIVGHLQRFEKNSKNIGLAPAYALGVNLSGNQNALNNDANALAEEFQKLASGGVGAEAAVDRWIKGLHSPSAEARQQSVDELSQLVGSQFEGMNQAYKAAVGEDLPLDRLTNPQVRQWIKDKGINVLGTAGTPAAAAPASGGPAAAPARTRTGLENVPTADLLKQLGK